MRQAENLLEKRYKVSLSSLKEKEAILGVCMDVKRKKRPFLEEKGGIKANAKKSEMSFRGRNSN